MGKVNKVFGKNKKIAEFCQNTKSLTFILILAKYKENLLNRDA